jgi:hypothetical protein
MVNRIEQNQGHAVGKYKKEGQGNRISDEGIAIYFAGAGVIPIDAGHSATVNLVCADWVAGFSAKGGAKAGEIFQYARTVIAAAVAEIQTPPRVRRYAAVAGADVGLEWKRGKAFKGIGNYSIFVGSAVHS